MGKVVKAVVSPVTLLGDKAASVVFDVASLVATATGQPWLAAGLQGAKALLIKKKGPRPSAAQLSRLNPSLDPNAHRKITFGRTAFPTDIRYIEPSGTNQEFIDYIIAVAAHEVGSIDEIWFEEKLAWSLASGVQAPYSGFLTVTPRTVGTAANTVAINGGGKWGSDDRLTGCAYVHIRIKRLDNDQQPSILSDGLPGRVTIIGNGFKCYDPRFDSSVGGSGTQRADNQATWGTNATSGQNPVIQTLNYLLGWRINGKLSVGCGIPAKRIDMASFITAANICDEPIALSGGGSQPRYRSGGVFSEADSRLAVIESLLSACAGSLRDAGGRLSVDVLKNDLASPVVAFVTQDVLSDVDWNPADELAASFNVVRGSFTDPSNQSLYQMSEYAAVSLPSPDGIERTLPLDLPVVQNAAQAQRLAKQTLQRAQYTGTLQAEFNARALACVIGDVVSLSFEPFGWSAKLFRVLDQTVSRSGRIAMTLREEHEDIYQWDAEDSALVEPADPTVFDPANAPLIRQAVAVAAAAGKLVNIDDGATRNKFEGEHQAGIAYLKGDEVRSPTGTLYRASRDVPAGIPLGDAEYWELIVSPGDVDLGPLEDRVSSTEEEINILDGQVSDLFDTYGSTVAAAQSASDAAQSAVDAAIASGLSEEEAGRAVAASNDSRLALAAQFPEAINAGLFYSGAPNGAPTAQVPVSQSQPGWIVDGGAAIQPPAGIATLYAIATVPLIPGRVYEATIILRGVSGPARRVAAVYRALDVGYAALNQSYGPPQTLSAGEETIITHRFSVDGTGGSLDISNDTASAHVRIGAAINRSIASSIDLTENGAVTKVKALYVHDVTARAAAETAASVSEGWAADAADDAASAAANRSLTAEYRDTALQYRNEAGDSAIAAQTFSEISEDQAVISTAAAAAARSSSLTSARVGNGGSIIPNPSFGILNTAGTFPESWEPRTDISGGGVYLAPGLVSDNALRIDIPSGQPNNSLGVRFFNSPQPAIAPLRYVTPGVSYTLDLDVTLRLGNFNGCGVRIRGFTNGGSAVEEFNINCARSDDFVGPTYVVEVGRRYSFSKRFTFTNPNVSILQILVVGGWNGFGDATTSARAYDFHKVLPRPTSGGEYAVAGVAAQVSAVEGALVDVEARTAAAYFTRLVTAGAGIARLGMVANDNNGQPTSAIELVAQAVFLGEKRALEIVGNDVRVNGNLSASSSIALGTTGNLWPIALRPRRIPCSDGETVSFGVSLGGLPAVEFSTEGLAPLNSGESYSLYPDNLTENGFIARLRINTPGGTNNYSVSNDTAGTGAIARQVERGSSPAATSGLYTFQWTGTISGRSNPLEPQVYNVLDRLYVRKSGVWQTVTDASSQVRIEGPDNGFQNYAYTGYASVQCGSGVDAFGIGRAPGSFQTGAVTDITSVSWSNPGSAAGERTATPNGQKSIATVTPQ